METYRPVVGWEGMYEVSDRGTVRTVPRSVDVGGKYTRRLPRRTLTRHGDEQGRLKVTFHAGGKTYNRRVAPLVAEAFIGPRPPGQVVRHLNGDPADNRVENLAYGTQSENMLDMVRHGRNNVAKRECPQGHPYTEGNLRIIPKTGGRVCRACQAAWARVQRGAPRDQFEQIADNYYRQFAAPVGDSGA